MLFPVRRPTIGLSLESHALTSIELARSLWAPRRRDIRSVKRHEVGSDLLFQSSNSSDALDISALVNTLKAFASLGRCTPVALSLPTRLAHIALMSFDDLPPHSTERDSVIRWKLEQEVDVPLKHCRVEYRIFARSTSRDAVSAPAFRVLAAAISTVLLTQCERACAEAGLLPVSIGIQGLQLFDLYRSKVHSADEYFFASLLGDHLFFLAIKHSRPVFVRSKSLKGTPLCRQLELASTLQFYDDIYAVTEFPHRHQKRSLYLIQDASQPADLSASTCEPSPCPNRNPLEDMSLRVRLSPVLAEDFSVTWPTSDLPWTEGLPALASLAS